MATKNRTDLKSYFVKNAIPTEGNFADLIDSQLNQAQDGVFKPDGEALSVVAAPGDQKRVLRLYASYPADNPDWMITLNPFKGPNATTSRPGFGITDGTGKTRLFIDPETGNIGMGTTTPQYALEVTGAVGALRFRPRYDTILNDYQTRNPLFNVGLEGPPADRDAWIYRVPATSGGDNWGIYHREINTAIAGLPGNSIGFVGGGTSKLQAYVSLADGSGFFAGNLTVSGKITALGGMQGSGSRTQYDLVLNDYQTVNPSSNVCLPGPPSDRDAWIYRGSDSSSNWGIYHRDINTAVAGLPGNSIGFVGGGSNKLQAYVNLTDGSGFFAGNLTASGEIQTKGYWVSARGGDCMFGSDAANGMFIMSKNSRMMQLIVTNPSANSLMDVVCRSTLQNSDARSKDRIEPITGALARVVRLCGVSFDWKADNRVEGASKHLGLIAQQVREVVPEAVVDAREGSLAITYNAITALLVEAIKEQQQHIDELRAALTPAPVH